MRKLLIFFIALIVYPVYAQDYTPKDIDKCNSTFELAVNKKLDSEPINTVISTIGRSFIGTPYEAFTNEKEGAEKLVIHLTGLDCTTYLENVLTFARCIKEKNTTFDNYMKELTFIRYRNGKLDKYPSRLHYFSDWIFDNAKKGVVKDVTKEIGGEEIQFNMDYMTTHIDSYRQLKENPDFVAVVKKQEQRISKRKYYYIPNARVESVDGKIQDGDLIAIVTNIKGIDIGHVGIAVRQDDGKIHFMHAPIVGSKVQITPDPLPIYLSKVAKHKGIIVLRVQEPKASCCSAE